MVVKPKAPQPFVWNGDAWAWGTITTTGTGTATGYKQPNHIPTRVIYNPPYTICYFDDGTKEVVKCSEGDTFIDEVGVMACIMKRVFPTRGAFEKLVDSGKWQNQTDGTAPSNPSIATTNTVRGFADFLEQASAFAKSRGLTKK